MMMRIRELDVDKDLKAVEEMERLCDVGPSSISNSGGGGGDGDGKKNKKRSVSLHVDQLGDPLCRIRHSPEHVMLVAEYGESREIVGVIRASIKTVTRGLVDPTTQLPIYVRVAYILGLRVSPTHRRQGIGTKLVQRVEWWSRQKGAVYAYMATNRSNSPSLNLFTSPHLTYTPFRSLAILTRPVHSHPLPLPSPSSTTLLRLSPSLSSPLYHRLFSSPSTSSEFFPSDFDSLLSNPLTLATFLAFPTTSSSPPHPQWDPLHLPSSFALMSLWNTKDIFHLRIRGASALLKAAVRCARALDRMCPWLHVPSVRDVFKPFGVYVMYGLYIQGERGEEMMSCLCRVAHNMAMEDEEVAAVVAEVGGRDHVRGGVPHWKRFSCEEDVWCMKRLDGGDDDDDDDDDDWSRSKAMTDVMFVDPREF